jgi:hypothetical protein
MAQPRSRGSNRFHDPAADGDLAVGDFLEAGDEPQKRRFPATGGAENDQEFTVPDIQVDAMHDLHSAETLSKTPDANVCHSAVSLLFGRDQATYEPALHQYDHQ